MSDTPRIKPGDTVIWMPPGETWLVATVDYERDRLQWSGWPEGTAKLSECELVKSCSEEEERDTVLEWCKPHRDERGHTDSRHIWARREALRRGWRGLDAEDVTLWETARDVFVGERKIGDVTNYESGYISAHDGVDWRDGTTVAEAVAWLVARENERRRKECA
jgi:hypothetical protein